METPRKKRGLLKGALSVATAALLALGGGAAAHAAPIITDPDAVGNLHINKFEEPDSGDRSNGLPIADTSAWTPIPGVTYTATLVDNIDLTTNSGWDAATALTPAQAAGQLTTTTVSGTTNASGYVELEDLEIGLWYVEETAWPVGVTPAAPFLVTMPLSHPTDNDTWLYDVYVYPKNAKTGITKEISDAEDIKLGDTVTWSVYADIPKIDAIDGYKIRDDFHESLEYVAPPVVTLTGTSGITLVDGVDYNVVLNDASQQPIGANVSDRVDVVFTADGRAKLVQAWQADAAAQVKVDFNTRVLEVGEIDNQAILFPNEGTFGWDPSDPDDPNEPPTSNEVTTKWGDIILNKVDARDSDNKLEGAEFSVYATEADALAQTNPIAFSTDPEDPAAATKTVFESNADGEVVISGVRYSDYADGKDLVEGTDPEFRAYWVVEVTSPDGYELLTAPVKVIVNESNQTIATGLEIENAPHNAGFELPLTGGAGTTMFTIGGLLLIVGGLALAIRRKKNVVAA